MAQSPMHLPKQLAVYMMFEPLAHVIKQKTHATECGNPKRVSSRNVTSCFGSVDCIDCLHSYARFIRDSEVILGIRSEY